MQGLGTHEGTVIVGLFCELGWHFGVETRCCLVAGDVSKILTCIADAQGSKRGCSKLISNSSALNFIETLHEETAAFGHLRIKTLHSPLWQCGPFGLFLREYLPCF